MLLGGATALLPVYAKDILHVGAERLGWLQGALPVGSALMAVVMAHRPPHAHAGRTMLWPWPGFGLATVVFGLSRSFWLSLCDDVSSAARWITSASSCGTRLCKS